MWTVKMPEPGDRIEVLDMPGDDLVAPGLTGTVEAVRPGVPSEIEVEWDSGLVGRMVCPPDRYRIIDEKGGPSSV